MHRYPYAPVRKEISVECVAIDEFLNGEPIHLVKMDIEGNEYSALEGMRKTIERSNRLVMICEFEPFFLRRAGIEPEAYIEELLKFNFDVSVINEETRSLKPLSDEIFKPHSATWHVNLFCKKQ